MPGMMDTVLNLGLNDEVVTGLAAKSGERFANDSYRRFLDMFGDVVSISCVDSAGFVESEMSLCSAYPKSMQYHDFVFELLPNTSYQLNIVHSYKPILSIFQLMWDSVCIPN